MLTKRPADQRGASDLGWLDSRHTFSFAGYFDPKHMGFGPLRVINDDRVTGGGGFGTHGHQDMEIISYVLEGSLKHKDSMGNGSMIRPGEVQRMSAGTGVQHSEFNGSDSELVHFLQIWIIPKQKGQQPGYEQKEFPAEERAGQWRLVGSPTGEAGSVTIRQDVKMFATLLTAGQSVAHHIAPGRKGWLHVCSGSLQVNDHDAGEGDGFALEGPEDITLVGSSDTEALLFDMADIDP
jgi:redox-sensitive bicupin YhaK (pirin superfamily)